MSADSRQWISRISSAAVQRGRFLDIAGDSGVWGGGGGGGEWWELLRVVASGGGGYIGEEDDRILNEE